MEAGEHRVAVIARWQRLLEGRVVACVFEPVEVDCFLRARYKGHKESRDYECAKEDGSKAKHGFSHLLLF
jgi:hypothetical protein